jgi:hypothetical protein
VLAVVAASLAAGYVFFIKARPISTIPTRRRRTPMSPKLMKPGALPDMSIGSADAPNANRRIRLDDLPSTALNTTRSFFPNSRRNISTPARRD